MNPARIRREKVFRQRGTRTTCGRWAEFYPQISKFRISDASSEPDSNNLPTSSAGEPAALKVGKDFCGHRFFRIENRVRGKTVNSNRDQDIALENMQYCHAGLVRAEDGFITKPVDTSRFAAIGGQRGKHCLGKMRRSFSPRIENVKYESLIAFDRMITPLRIVVATSAVLVAAFSVFDRRAQNFLGIGPGDDSWDVDFVASHRGTHTDANNDQNSEANHCSPHKIISVKFEAKDDGIAASHQFSIMSDRRIALCDQASNI